MNTEKISRLEQLLGRIKANAAAPRTTEAHAPVMVAHAPAVVATQPPPAEAPVMLEAAAQPEAALDPITTPPPSNPEYDEDDVEVSSEVVEVDIDIDEPYEAAAPAAESGVNELVEVRDEEEEEEELAPNTQSSSLPPMEDEPELRATPANEIEEPSPSSSRRPIASEEPADDESSPRHTPPPESGKQVAPSIAPRNSQPPPSLEGHTLIGGWREPGAGGAPNIVTGFGTGVRVPAPAPAAAPEKLVAEVAKPTFATTSHVASIEGTPPAFKPSNFGELLEASIEL